MDYEIKFSQEEAKKKLKTKAVVLRCWPTKHEKDKTLIHYVWRQAKGPRAVTSKEFN